MRFHLVAVLAITSAVLACVSPGADVSVPRTSFGAHSIAWAPCPEELGGPSFDCTQLAVPIDWNSAGPGPTTSILVRRLLVEQPSRGTLWLLDGGPGFAGDVFLEPSFLDLVRRAGLDLYIPSHRGTIGESALRCPSAQGAETPGGGRVVVEEWPACRGELEARWGPGLDPFTVRAGALDVAHAMSLLPEATTRSVFGGSYGSLWAHRLLLDTNARVDRVLLDSIVPIGASLERVDVHADEAVRQILLSCSEIASCAALFPGTPLEASRAALGAMADGEGCGHARGLTAEVIQTRVHAMLNGPPEDWIRVVALYERLVRCEQDDVDALLRVLRPETEPKETQATRPSYRYNPLLNRHLLYRELYRFDWSEAQRSTFEQSALALGPNRLAVIDEAAAFGPGHRVVDEPRRPTSTVPVVLLSGRLDPLDLPAWAQDFADTLPRGRVVHLPWAGHSTLRYLGLDEGQCGRAIFEAWLAGDEVNATCGEQAAPPDLGREHDETKRMVEAWFEG